MIEKTSPMTECYYTDEDEEISCAICNIRLAIAHRRYKNMKFENGTYKHLLRKEEFEGSAEVCKINDLITNSVFYLCKEHYEQVMDIKSDINKESFPDIINEVKLMGYTISSLDTEKHI